MKTILIKDIFKVGDEVITTKGRTGVIKKVSIDFDEQYNQTYTYTVEPLYVLPTESNEPMELTEADINTVITRLK